MYSNMPYMDDMGYKFLAFKGIRLLMYFAEGGTLLTTILQFKIRPPPFFGGVGI